MGDVTDMAACPVPNGERTKVLRAIEVARAKGSRIVVIDGWRTWLDDALADLPPCETCHGEQMIERLATPAEVDAGCELGIAYDPCPDCSRRDNTESPKS